MAGKHCARNALIILSLSDDFDQSESETVGDECAAYPDGSAHSLLTKLKTLSLDHEETGELTRKKDDNYKATSN